MPGFRRQIWKELGRRNAILYMHPWVPGCCNNLNYGASSFMNEIDFETTRLSSKFTFRNPNQTDACGCGESVTIEPAQAEA